MIVRNAIAPAAMALVLFAAPADAGPCTDRIYQTDLAVEKLLDAAAAKEAGAGIDVRDHASPANSRAPSPARKTKAGNLSPAHFEAITEDMDAARDADDKGDSAACEKALNEVDRILHR